jgi:hypothetical protein
VSNALGKLLGTGVDAAVGPWRLCVFRGVLGAPGQLSDEEPIDTVPNSIAGHTVVSSVYRGPADLTFGGGRVLFTTGFPAIGAVMNLTHGVHGTLGPGVDVVNAGVGVDRDGSCGGASAGP